MGENYTALYRKFRPLTFSEMVGQEPITKTLKHQIMSQRVGHAYLFNGGRGTGKTSSAKVLARAINCLNPQEGEPCNECEICKEALSGSLTDIVEMDAASNNSVEDIRSIREEVNFLPTKAKYRVYIIDEVHMLSTGAFNALLKTLEEPPKHVKFILATTEPQKLPATILSRCQRFDFKRIANEEIKKRLEFVAKESKIEITDQALNIIAVLSEGAMRDALSILERCIQDGDHKIDEDKIRDLTGIPKQEQIYQMVKAITQQDVEQVLKTIEEVSKEGKDSKQFLWEMIEYIKNILMYQITKTAEIYSEQEIKQIQQLAEKLSKQRAIELIYQLSELENDLKWSTQKLTLFQAGMIKFCYQKENSMQELEQVENRIKRLEQALTEGKMQRTSIPKETKATRETIVPEKRQEPKRTIQSTGKMKDDWPKVLQELKSTGKIILYTNLVSTVAREINDMTIGIEFPQGLTPFGKTLLEKPENMKLLQEMVSMACGKEMQIKLIDIGAEKPKKKKSENNLEDFANGLDIPFNVIDE